MKRPFVWAWLLLGCLAWSTPVRLDAACASPSCSTVERLDDGTYVVNDCWCKTCRTWASRDEKTVALWNLRAGLDGALC